MKENRGPWYLLTGFVIGVALGLLYAWVVRPVQYTNTAPDSLRNDYKDQYRAVIGAAYLANGDLVRARARLDLLQDEDLYRMLAEQAQRTLAEGGSPQEARGLGLLAVALGQSPAAADQSTTVQTTEAQADANPGTAITTTLAVSATNASPTQVTATLVLETPAITPLVTDLGLSPASPTSTLEVTPNTGENTQTPSQGLTLTPGTTPTPRARATGSPTPTGTPLPTRTPTTTPGAPFVLDRQQLLCDPDLIQALIQVQVYDAAGQPVPGVEAVITWEGGENHFFTGVKPEINPGYADFVMEPGVQYTLRLAEGGQIIPDLTPTECERTGGERYWGAWRLLFVQP